MCLSSSICLFDIAQGQFRDLWLGENLLKFGWFLVSLYLASFIYLGFYVAFNTVQVISRRVVGMAEETSTYS